MVGRGAGGGCINAAVGELVLPKTILAEMVASTMALSRPALIGACAFAARRYCRSLEDMSSSFNN